MSAPMKIEDHGTEGLVILDRNGNYYAKTYSWVDARFIAAAPALLEALERMIANNGTGAMEWAINNARAAIRAAKEGQ